MGIQAQVGAVNAFEHWLTALEPVDGDHACIGCQTGAEALTDDPAEWPSRYFSRCVVRLASLDAQSIARLGQLRNQYAQQIALWIDQPNPDDREPLLGLGFKGLPGPAGVACFGYDLGTYNHQRDWNNPKYWANPERWGQAFW